MLCAGKLLDVCYPGGISSLEHVSLQMKSANGVWLVVAGGQDKVENKHFDYRPSDSASTAVPPKDTFTLVKTYDFRTYLLSFYLSHIVLVSLLLKYQTHHCLNKDFYFRRGGKCPQSKSFRAYLRSRTGYCRCRTRSALRFLFCTVHTVHTLPQALLLS